MNFSIIIPTKDRESILFQTLEALKGVNNLSEIEVIIINDSHLPISLDLSKYPMVIKLFRNKGQGVSSARNYGAAKAAFDHIVFMDDDMIVDKLTFEKLKSFCKATSNYCLNINWVYPPSITEVYGHNPFFRYLTLYGFTSLKGWSKGEKWQDTGIFEVSGITSQFLVMEKRTFESVGGYNETFPFAGFEDYDLKIRLRENGAIFYLDPDNMIYHNEIDRLDIESWLKRKNRGAYTRRHAVDAGYTELSVHYHPLKKLTYNAMGTIKRILLARVISWKRNSHFDYVFFKLVNLLLGIYNFEGYNRKVNI